MPGRRRPEESRREDILRAAYDVAARSGIEALTLRAVARRAGVTHGTVLFHFDRRNELVTALLDRVVQATAVLPIPDSVSRIAHPSERLHELLRHEMERLSREPRHFRLFLEYWALGIRSPAIRRRIGSALEEYRAIFRTAAAAVVGAATGGDDGGRRGAARDRAATAEKVAAVSVSLIHGCALQALVDPGRFDVDQHFGSAARLVEHLATAPAERGAEAGTGA